MHYERLHIGSFYGLFPLATIIKCHATRSNLSNISLKHDHLAQLVQFVQYSKLLHVMKEN